MTTLYVHIPFCERKCFYCSFVVSVGQTHRIDSYIDCLAKEARLYNGTEVRSVYIGGGTPTLLNDGQLTKLFDAIRKNFHISPGAEWTIESNPEGLDLAKLKLLKKEGVNRISLGIQSLNDKYLKYLGRNHDSLMAQKAFNKIREEGFDNVNADLMFAFPDQTIEELRKDLNDVLQLGSDHLSLYTLTLEEHSRFFAKNIQLQDNHDQARQYILVCEALNAEGFTQYEISNFAKQTKVSQHNLNYWKGGHYVGLGVGAHSYIGARRFWNVSRLNDYISRIQKNMPAEEGFESLTPSDQMKEVILFGLRMNQGVDVEQAEEHFHCCLDEERKKKIDEFIQSDFLFREDGYLRASAQGRLVLDELCAQLI